jgi:hypothetical protein
MLTEAMPTLPPRRGTPDDESLLDAGGQLSVGNETATAAGQILVHNQIRSVPEAYEGTRGFRAWWARPGKEFSLCACGWRPDLKSITAFGASALSFGGSGGRRATSPAPPC